LNSYAPKYDVDRNHQGNTDFYVSKKKIFCPWELKGRVMRTLITEKDQEKVELLDGVKFILENGWPLSCPTRICPFAGFTPKGDT